MMRNKSKRVIASVLVLCMTFFWIVGDKVELIAADNGRLNEYVITVKNEKEMYEIKEEYEKYVVDDYSIYEDRQTFSMYMGLTEKQADKLNSQDGVIAVEENVEFQASGNWKKNKRKKSKRPDALDWNLRMIGGDYKKNNNIKDSVKIAVMDSGIDFSENINVAGHVNLVDEENYIPEFYEDVTGHGTAIAGIISDVNKKAEIYSVRVLDSHNTGKLDRIIEGIYWCIDHDIQIINMSFGTKVNSQALKKAVEDAENAGILMVAATGNGAEQVEYPAAYDEVIAVGAVDSEANVTEESNIGEEVELVAPGKQINAEGLFGGNIVVGGTSMSVAHVAGAASVIWSQDSGKSENFVRGLLDQSAKKVDVPEKSGYGLVDIKYALKQYKEYEKGYNEEWQVSNTKEDTEKDYVIEANIDAVETYDDIDLVEGLWDDKGHKDIIDNADKGADNQSMAVGCFTTDELTFIKETCISMDKSAYESYFKDSTLKVFHGKYNYLGTMDYLYRVLRDVYTTGDDVTINASCKKFSYSPDCEGTDGGRKNTAVAADVKEAIRFMASASGPMAKIQSGKSVTWKRRRGLAILGMLMHTIGDTYAHKTKVPTTVGSSTAVGSTYINKADLKTTWSQFRSEVDRGLMFRDTEDYLEGNYADKAGFFPRRYVTAQRVSNLVLRHFIVGSSYINFDMLIAEQSQKNGSTVVQENKLTCFTRHVKTTYGYSRMQQMGAYSFVPHMSEYGAYNFATK